MQHVPGLDSFGFRGVVSSCCFVLCHVLVVGDHLILNVQVSSAVNICVVECRAFAFTVKI